MQRLRHIWPYVSRQRRFVVVVLLLTLGAAVTAALQPWPMKLLVDHVLEKRPLTPALESFFQALSMAPSTGTLLAVTVGGGLLLFALNAMLEVVSTVAWTVAGRRMVYDLAETLFAKLQRRSLLFYSRTSVGELMSRVTGDCWAVYQLADTLLFAPIHALLTTAVMIFLMSRLDPTLTWISLIAAPFMIGASFLIGKPLREASSQRREAETKLQSHVQQILSGIPVVQAFAQEERERSRFQGFADQAIRIQQRTTLMGSINALSSGLITTLGTGLILWVGAKEALAGNLSIGSLLAFLVYLNLLQAQMKILASTYTTAAGFSARVDRVIETLSAASDLPENPAAKRSEKVSGHVRFENVSFGYAPGKPVLKEISFEVQPGQAVAIVGASGAGKTTLVNLLPRFFDPSAGRVLLDRKNIREFELESLRRQIALVLQEPFLFPVSVAENIRFGRTDATQEQIEAAAHAANAHEFISRLPEGYHTVIGEHGATLSGGERQRLAIARALLKDAPILILDEPTSALDAQTEADILEALQHLMQNRTTLLIAHRLSTVRKADRIIVLQDGRISESGTHDELISRGKFYAQLHNIQFERTT
jgi:ATP-binding cassette, subfamily B, bacterial